MSRPDEASLLGERATDDSVVVARNLSTRYVAIATEAALGVLILPFNVAHLGTSAYGLWVLAASVTAYFSVLDMGYSGALVKFVAQYRTRRDVRALNEILSTLFFVFLLAAVVMYGAAGVLALFVDRVFHLAPDQTHTARLVLMIVTVNVAASTAFSVFGGVINGFQRYDLNNMVGSASSIVTAVVNVAVLMAGYGLIELVIAMTAVRVLTLWIYRANAYRVFPGLRISASLFRRARLREVTGFSIHMAVIDWANKLNYSVDALVIGAFVNTTAVAVWAIAQRLAELSQRLANQLNDILFPAVVENDTAARLDRLQRIFIEGTKLSLATVVPMSGAMLLMAGPLVTAWVGAEFSGSILILQILSVIVMIRVGNATGMTVLKGAGSHRAVSVANISTALCNVVLSIALVRPMGLAGVALGTLVPVGISSIFVLFPMACRRVELPVLSAVVRGVWPAVWPGLVMAAFIVATRSMVPSTLLGVAAECAAAGLVYALTFVLFSLTTVERHFYVGKVAQMLHIGRLLPAEEPL
ncbi:MAG TPA: oligosaccharide flippase family protein [Vicinamibacterales bacterium]|nr:oligosaccharide flippase family protein [Vicinamibacterales bacterium]